jgi:Ion channel
MQVIMLVQITLGTCLLLLSVLFSALNLWVMELAFLRSHDWLIRRPHRPKLVILAVVFSMWLLFIITAGVWIWATAFYLLAAFPTLEESVYFSLVVYTTLGLGDVLLPLEWRILAGMAAANGFLNFGLMTALLIEALRQVRTSQLVAQKEEEAA